MQKKSFAVFTLLFTFTLAGCGEIDINEIKDQEKQEQTADTDDSSDNDDEDESDNDDTDDPSKDNPSDDQDDNGDSGTDSGTGTGSGTEDDSGTGTDSETDSSSENQSIMTFTQEGHLLIGDSLYVSLEDFRTVHSAYYASSPNEAAELAGAYTEKGLVGWHIPTEGEARFLKSILDDDSAFYGNTNLPKLNQMLLKRDLDAIDIGSRYLCADAQKTYSFLIGSNITKAGSKTTYRMRLVREKQK